MNAAHLKNRPIFGGSFFVKSSAFGCSGDAMLHLNKAL